ncbi:MAG: TIGR02099 family protein [Colwellia sp.]|nr:TIGR02099 family protein [Colwellia sp.]
MSITSASNRWLNRFYKILAILLVLIAVLISASRLFLPYVEHYREDFQHYINEVNETDIIIGTLGMSWQQWGPSIVAKQVTLVDNENAYAFIERLEVQIDFWSSVIKQRFISSNLILEGVKLELAQTAWDSTETTAQKPPTDKTESGFEQISAMFLNRLNRFSLRNTHIIINNQKFTRDFYISNLHWINQGDRHQAQGHIIIDELSGNNLVLKIDVLGDAVDELKGVMYVEANHLDITPWLDNVLALDNNKTKTDIGFTTWLKINNGKLDRVQVQLHDNYISWQDNDKQHDLFLKAGQLLLVKEKKPDSFKLFSTPLSMQFDQQNEQAFIIQVNKDTAGFSGYLSAFDLALFSQVSPLFIKEQKTRDLFSQLNIVGAGQDIYFKKTAENIQALANFTEVSTQYSQGIPGIEHLSGQLSFTENNLHLTLSAEQGSLDFEKLFIKPIVYQSLNADVDLSFTNTSLDKQGWQLQVNNLVVASPELTMDADLAINSQEDSEMTMSLLASITDGDASQVGHYFPLTTMSAGLIDYLNTAIVSGNIKQAQVLVNGPLSHFPFVDNSGIFIVDAELEQAVFSFDDEWPAIIDFAANLNFTNNSMLITGRDGSLAGLNVNGIQAAIDNLGHKSVLTVDTIIKPSPAGFVTDLMRQSPLDNSVGTVLTQLQIGGNIQGKFHLNLPLSGTKQVLASGIINFVDNKMALQSPRMDFAQVNGQLSFTNDKISTKNLSLAWLDMPLKLDVHGVNHDDYYDTNILITADWSEHTWQQNVTPMLKKHLNGQVSWQAELSLYQHYPDGFSYDFSIDSELTQTLINLPAPYKKTQGEKVPLTIRVNGKLHESILNVHYGDQLSFLGVLEHKGSHFDRAHLVLGDENMLLPTDGFDITTKLTQVDFSDWQPLIHDIIDIASSNSTDIDKSRKYAKNKPSLFPKPEHIHGTLTKLDIFGQQLNNVSFNLLDTEHWWLLQLNAKEIQSRIKIFPDLMTQGIDIDADFIHLASSEEDEKTQPLLDHKVDSAMSEQDVFANIPKLKLHCKQCQVGKLDLGEINFSLSHSNKNIITIDHFTAKREQAEFTVTGEWEKSLHAENTVIERTSIQGNLALKDIEYELEQFGYGSIIRDSGGKLKFALNWQGGPHEFSVEHLNGKLNTKIDDGYLADVSDKARIFSVLSLESLVRKLTLDFRDIFSNGMFYSDIKGDFNIEEGVLYTDNTRMNGTAGNLYVKGNTNFKTNLLDYKLSYKPNLTSSLPVIAWIATLNPVVFLAGVAIDQVITSQVVSEFNFELTGDIDKPSFKEVKRKSRDISVSRTTAPKFVDDESDNDMIKKNDTPK